MRAALALGLALWLAAAAPAAAQRVDSSPGVAGSLSGSISDYFKASRSTSQSLTSGVATTVLFDSVSYDVSSGYTAGTGIYQPKTPGLYLFTACLMVTGGFTLASANSALDLVSELGFVARSFRSLPTLTLIDSNCVSTTVRMNGTTNTMMVQATVTATTPSVVGNGTQPDSWFTAVRLGNQ